MKKLKRFISLFMLTITLSLTVSNAYCQSVYSAEIAKGLAYNMLQGFCVRMGYIIADSSVAPYALEKMQKWIDEKTIEPDSNGNYAFSEEQVQELLDAINASQEENVPDLVWFPVISASDFKASHFYNTDFYYRFRSSMEQIDLGFVCVGSDVPYFTIYDFSDYVPCYAQARGSNDSSWVNVINGVALLSSDFWATLGTYTCFHLMSSNGQYLDLTNILGNCYADHEDGNGIFLSSSEYYTKLCYFKDHGFNLYYYPNYVRGTYISTWTDGANSKTGFLVSSDDVGFKYVPIFYDVNAYKDYITGGSEIYRVAPQYQGGDITINPNIDYGQIYDAVRQGMLDSVQNGEKISNQISHMQDVYNQTMQKLLNVATDIEDNTQESNSWLEKIYNKVTNIDDVIAEQFNQLLDAITQGFSDVTDGLSDLSFDITVNNNGDGDSDGSSGSDKKSFWEKLGELPAKLITGVLSLISKLVFKALDGLAYLSKIVVDKTVGVFDGIGEYFDRYTALFPEDSLIMNLSAVLPDELTDIIVLLMFGAVVVGIVTIVKR